MEGNGTRKPRQKWFEEKRNLPGWAAAMKLALDRTK